MGRQRPGWGRAWKPGPWGSRQQAELHSCEQMLVTPELFPFLTCLVQDPYLVREGLIG